MAPDRQAMQNFVFQAEAIDVRLSHLQGFPRSLWQHTQCKVNEGHLAHLQANDSAPQVPRLVLLAKALPTLSCFEQLQHSVFVFSLFRQLKGFELEANPTFLQIFESILCSTCIA